MLNRLFALFLVSVMPTTLSAADAPSKKPLEFEAHRGESHDAPENTMAAFKIAWERADAAELDVHLTKDGKLIVSHDADTGRVTGGKNKLIIKETTADELRKLDVGSWKDPKFAGEKLPLLDEVLPTIPAGKRLFIEVKIGPEAIPELVRCLDRAKKSPEQTAVIAFNIETAKAAKKALPKIKVYWLANQKQDKETKEWKPSYASLVAKTKAAGVDGLDFGFNPTFNADSVKAVHDAGLEMYVWTVDDPDKAKKLAEWGVQGITTNRAAWLREQVTGKK
jgi:glycerophosphoryl diester phosphodiesterase